LLQIYILENPLVIELPLLGLDYLRYRAQVSWLTNLQDFLQRRQLLLEGVYLVSRVSSWSYLGQLTRTVPWFDFGQLAWCIRLAAQELRDWSVEVYQIDVHFAVQVLHGGGILQTMI